MNTILALRDRVFGPESDPKVKLAQAIFTGFQMGYGAEHSEFVADALEPLFNALPRNQVDDAIDLMHVNAPVWRLKFTPAGVAC